MIGTAVVLLATTFFYCCSLPFPGGNDAVICAQCSDTQAGVRWTALATEVTTIKLWYYCYNSEGTDVRYEFFQ